jgi:copper chaperone
MSEFKVPDMSCGHCEKAITKALKAANSSADVKINLSKKTIQVTNVPDETVVELLKDIGYTPEKVK